jgi:GNAT superfamily N-acetyltransferase
MAAPTVREILPGESQLAHAAMVELGRDVGDVERFTHTVDGVLRGERYRLVGAFVDGETEAAAAAGFRISHDLVHGSHLFVDDLATRARFRKQGCAAALMAWLKTEAGRAGCRHISLESGVQRHDAHRFYLKQGFVISSHHFRFDLDS